MKSLTFIAVEWVLSFPAVTELGSTETKLLPTTWCRHSYTVPVPRGSCSNQQFSRDCLRHIPRAIAPVSVTRSSLQIRKDPVANTSSVTVFSG